MILVWFVSAIIYFAYEYQKQAAYMCICLENR